MNLTYEWFYVKEWSVYLGHDLQRLIFLEQRLQLPKLFDKVGLTVYHCLSFITYLCALENRQACQAGTPKPQHVGFLSRQAASSTEMFHCQDVQSISLSQVLHA